MGNNLHVIIGLGATGLSCAQYLTRQNLPIALNDTRQVPPYLDAFKQQFPQVPLSLGGFDEKLLHQASCLVVSPGVSIRQPAIATQIARGTPVVGDIELFARAVKKPVVAITGTNAKSTVTTLVGQMVQAAGLSVAVGGNLGTPALDLLSDRLPALFVLELSSFQLETTCSLRPQVATVLNVTHDHMDRYRNLEDYASTKRQVYQQCQVAVCNRDDPLTEYADQAGQRKFYFTLSQPRENEFGLLSYQQQDYLAFAEQRLLAVDELPMIGRHYQANALAALAIGHGLGLPLPVMLETLISFKGLPHRCQRVRERLQVCWYNDSKGTNVGATLAAMEGLAQSIPGRLIWIAGGVGKNADFSPLALQAEKYVRKVILIGEAAPLLAQVLKDRVPVQLAKSMEEAVALADRSALPGDSVLLSPACASFDMFKNFEHRGETFMACVQGLQ